MASGVPKEGQLQEKATCSGRSTVRPTGKGDVSKAVSVYTISPASYTVSKGPRRGERQPETYHIVQYTFVYSFIMLDPSALGRIPALAAVSLDRGETDRARGQAHIAVALLV
jgi:hypothetical protein